MQIFAITRRTAGGRFGGLKGVLIRRTAWAVCFTIKATKSRHGSRNGFKMVITLLKLQIAKLYTITTRGKQSTRLVKYRFCLGGRRFGSAGGRWLVAVAF